MMTPDPAHPAEPDASALASEIELVVRREHADPHHVLGAHPSNGGVVLRAFRPAAEKVLARLDGGEPVALEQRHPAGLFEGLVDGAELPLRYELEVSYPDGNTFTVLDPYAFPPTFGELDLHLVGELDPLNQLGEGLPGYRRARRLRIVVEAALRCKIGGAKP